MLLRLPASTAPPAPRRSCKCPAPLPIKQRGATRVLREVKVRFSDGRSNPLELLRQTPLKEHQKRAALLRELDSSWSEAAEAYQPTEVEALISKELGIWSQTVMTTAISNPEFTAGSAEDAKAVIRALKAANIEPQDIWFLLSKKHHLLRMPTIVQRWLDFLSVYGLQPRNTQNFLLRASEGFLRDVTLYQAGQVVTYLTGQLGLKHEYLAQRVLCVWPEVLGRDVEGQVKPVVGFLMRLGIEVSDINGIICLWPELLLCDVDSQLAPWTAYLKHEVGCTSVHVAEIIMSSPHLLGFKASEVFGPRMRSLAAVGVTRDDLARMCSASLRWLLGGGGVQQQVDFLLGPAGFSPEEVRTLVVAAPGVLAEKDFELERKWQWLTQSLGVTRADVLACPEVMGIGLMQVLGPRHGFLFKEGKLGASSPSSSSTTTTTATSSSSSGSELLARLARPLDDVDWAIKEGVPALDYARYRAHWEEEYTQGLSRSAAQEFQDELRKLGIYEGTD